MNTRILSLLLLAGCSAGPVSETSDAVRARPNQHKRLSSGSGHTCRVRADSKLECWGVNTSGQLGTGSRSPYSGPVLASAVTSPVVAVAVGGIHTCVLTSGGDVQCFGYNWDGQIGTGALSGAEYLPYTVLSGAVDITAGIKHSCALLANGTAKCWGQNDDYQLGDGTIVDHLSPAPVSLTTTTGAPMANDLVELSAGSYFTCGLRANGDSICWGAHANGQLGVNGAIMPIYSGSIEGDPVARIEGGGTDTCVVRTGGTVWCSGSNLDGVLATGSTDGLLHKYPLQIMRSSTLALTNAISVSVGWTHACAVVKGGQVFCWGDNDYGQVGSGGATVTRATQVLGLSNVVAVQAGLDFSCAQKASGDVVCWGKNDVAQLGNGTPSPASSTSPLAVSLSSDTSVVDLAVGGFHACQLKGDGQVECWGRGTDGQLGDGLGSDHSTPSPAASLTSAVAVTTGNYHGCALLANNTVQCWGSDTFGVLGDGFTSGNRTSPWPVVGLNDAVAIDAGSYHNCVITTSGAIKCWGSDSSGQLGDGPGWVMGGVVTVSGISEAFSVSAGYLHTCALHSGGLSCWGNNSTGQLGVSGVVTSNVPVAVSGLAGGEKQVSAGSSHTCALTDDGRVECWGLGDSGQLGDGHLLGSGEFVNHPVLTNLQNAIAISSGDRHSCALTSNGSLYCWGNNSWGQLGVTGSYASSPTLVPVGAKVVAVACGSADTCVLTDANAVICYGRAL